jgi:hypothetical protein
MDSLPLFWGFYKIVLNYFVIMIPIELNCASFLSHMLKGETLYLRL